MSISSIGTSSATVYASFNQTRQNQFQTAEQSASSGSKTASMPPPPPPSQSSNDKQLMAQELGIKIGLQQQDYGFNAAQLAEMAEDDSPMSKLFSALADNFDEADIDDDGVIKREEAMAFAEANGIEMPPPPGMAPAQTTDVGFSEDQLLALEKKDQI